MNKRITVCCLSALLLTANAYALPYYDGGTETTTPVVCGTNQWKGKRVAFLGDSITDKKHIGTTKCYWEYLAELLGIIPYSYGINGNRMDGLLKQAEQLLAEQGDSIDAIIIFAGTNDFNSGIPVGEWYVEKAQETMGRGGVIEKRKHRELLMDEETFKGRINRLMNFLKTNFPEKQIIMLTPIHRAFAEFGNKNVQPDELFANRIGVFIDEYIAAIKEAANVWALPVIDLNSISGLYPLNDAHVRYFHKGDTDRLHPNAEGHRRMAESLVYPLLALPATF